MTFEYKFLVRDNRGKVVSRCNSETHAMKEALVSGADSCVLKWDESNNDWRILAKVLVIRALVVSAL